MKKISTLLATLAIGVTGFSVSAQNLDPDAVVTQIDDLQWQLTWQDYTYVSPGGCIYETENSDYEAFIIKFDDFNENINEIPKALKKQLFYSYLGYPDAKTKQINIPTSVNYVTLDLEGLRLADGEYVVYIPADYFVLNKTGLGYNAYSEPQQFIVTIGDSVTVEHEVSFTQPQNDNIMDISWTNVTSLTPGKTVGAYMINTDTNEKYELYYLQGDLYSKANLRIVNDFLRLNLTNNYPDLPDGTYKLYIPANYVMFNGGSTGNAAIDGYEFRYVGPWNEGQVVCNGPDENGLITVTWTNAESIEWDTNYKGDGYFTTGIMLFDWDGDNEPVEVPYATNVTIEGTTMIISLEGLNLTNGEYRLYIPEDSVFITTSKGTDTTLGVYFVFTYTGGEDEEKPDTPSYELYSGEASWNIPMEDGDYIVNKGQCIEVSWPGTTLAPYEGRDEFDNAGLYNEFTGYLELDFGTDVTISEDNTKLLLNLSKLPTDVYYSVFIPEAYVFVNIDGNTYLNTSTGVYETEIFVYNDGVDEPDGVESIVNDNNGNYKAFNINGVKVLDSNNASDLNTLPKGLYIVNGKKVVVK